MTIESNLFDKEEIYPDCTAGAHEHPHRGNVDRMVEER